MHFLRPTMQLLCIIQCCGYFLLRVMFLLICLLGELKSSSFMWLTASWLLSAVVQNVYCCANKTKRIVNCDVGYIIFGNCDGHGICVGTLVVILSVCLIFNSLDIKKLKFLTKLEALAFSSRGVSWIFQCFLLQLCMFALF